MVDCIPEMTSKDELNHPRQRENICGTEGSVMKRREDMCNLCIHIPPR